MRGVVTANDHAHKDKSGKKCGKCDRQIRDVGKRYCDFSGAVMRDSAYSTIIVVVLIVVVVMERDQQHRAQHDHCHCEGNDISEALATCFPAGGHVDS